MVAPRSRLIRTAAASLSLALLAAIVPAAGLICLALAGVLVLIAAADAVAAGRSLDGIGIELPAIARMSKDRKTPLDVRVRNEQSRRKSLRIALGLPLEVQAEVDELDVLLPGESVWSSLTWTCLPRKRGRYRVTAAYVECASFLGFWATRREIPVQSEIRVYPNLLNERKKLAALFLNRSTLGLHAQRQIGKGRDFEKLREYSPGDGFDEIHWKATARRAKPITKVFQIERTQEVYVLIDASRLSSRLTTAGVPDSSILERLVTAALVLGMAADRQGDLFGLLSFTDKVERFVRARNGKSHYNTCRDALYTLQPQTVTPDFDELFSFIRLRLRRRALVICLTSLDDPSLADSFVKSIELIRKQHVVLVNMVRQPETAQLFTESSPESNDDLYRKLGGHLRWNRLRQLEKVLQRRGVRLSQVEHEQLSVELVSQYLNVKQRQLL
jgi:uncharacterized protein (DUF58 family)